MRPSFTYLLPPWYCSNLALLLVPSFVLWFTFFSTILLCNFKSGSIEIMNNKIVIKIQQQQYESKLKQEEEELKKLSKAEQDQADALDGCCG